MCCLLLGGAVAPIYRDAECVRVSIGGCVESAEDMETGMQSISTLLAHAVYIVGADTVGVEPQPETRGGGRLAPNRAVSVYGPDRGCCIT